MIRQSKMRKLDSKIDIDQVQKEAPSESLDSDDKPFKCDRCHLSYSISNSLSRHKRVHTGVTFKCDLCEYTSPQPENMRRHQRSHNGTKPFKCDTCDYSCSISSNLIVHKRLHTGQKPYKCDCCEYSCSKSSRLVEHKRSHSGEKIFRCKLCNSSFTTSTTLKAHNRVHSGEKPYHCNLCEYSFSQKTNLRRHQKSHSGVKPHKCDICDYACLSLSTLLAHQRSHTKQKPFKCDICDYCCSISGNLEKHKQIHSRIISHLCDHCNFGTKWRNSLQKHSQMHESQKEFKFPCLLQDGGTQPYSSGEGLPCTIRCQTAQHLEYHVQRNHTEEGISAKFESETKLADFLTSKGISCDRDWMNFIQFRNCKNIQGNKCFARPDFFLHARSAELGAIVLVGNDEFGHRQYKCDFERLWNVVHALQQTAEFKDVPIVYVRFNPHFYKIGEKYYDLPLAQAHEKLLQTIQSLKKEDITKPVNLIYVHYDRTESGELCVFQDDPEDVNDYADVYKHCVIKIV